MNVVISPAFLFVIGNNRPDSGLSNLIAKVAISIHKATIFSIVKILLALLVSLTSQKPEA